jgi:hypothetical protein
MQDLKNAPEKGCLSGLKNITNIIIYLALISEKSQLVRENSREDGNFLA